MRILVTGTIAGLEESDWLAQVRSSGAHHKISIAYFDLVARMTRNGEKPMERLLGTTDYILELIREREYERIGFEIEKHDHEHVIVRAPATVEWNRINRKFKDRNHTIYEILSWMNEEVSLSEDWAKQMNIRHVVMAVREPPQNLLAFFLDPKATVFYASYSMTHADPEIRKQVTSLIHKLRYYGVVIDPQSIEISSSTDPTDPKDKEATYSFTVHRDLHWYVGKCDAVVAVHPYLDRPPLSTGMMDELGHARDYHKARYMIFPQAFSPFVTDSYVEKGHVFDTGEQFFAHLEKEDKMLPKFRALYE